MSASKEKVYCCCIGSCVAQEAIGGRTCKLTERKTVEFWRDDAFENAALICERYEATDAARDIRGLKGRASNEPESWRPTNQQCDQIIGALEDHEWSGFSREDIRRLVNVIDQHRPSQPPVPAPSTSEIATFIRCREAIKAVDDGDSPAYAHAMEVIDDLISGAAHVRASQPPFPGLLERCGRCGYGHNVGNPCPPTGAL